VERTDPPRGLWLALGLIAIWAGAAASLNEAQMVDNFEQFIWAHSVEWGYYKHPPLPTWMLAVVIHAFGPSPYWTYALGAACAAGTAAFTYWTADDLVGPRRRDLALLLWGLQNAFSVRVQLYNHNTVMMLWIAACAWAVLKAVRREAFVYWLLAGVAAGLALLSKYQSAVPLAGIAVALALSGELARPATRKGLAVALLIAAVLVARHVGWVLEHGCSTLHYASQYGRRLETPARLWGVVVFLADQVRLTLPALLLLLLLRWTCRAPPIDGRPATGPQAMDARQRAWLIGLTAFPLLATVLVGLFSGLKLEGHWGFQCLQFAGLWLAWWSTRRAVPALACLSRAALAIHAITLGVTAWTASSVYQGRAKRDDTSFPAREFAVAVQRDWAEVTRCPLQLVVGPSFEAGMLSAYIAAWPRVLESGDHWKSPWIGTADVQQVGAAYVSTSAAGLPHGSMRTGSLLLERLGRPESRRVHWAIVPPLSCTLDAPLPTAQPPLP
jgi:4-amino-4-deoxy-L-arabinose transferase-like glycosyltransferase